MNIKDLLLGSSMRMSHIMRFSTIPVTHKESVAEHSFFTAFYAYFIGIGIAPEYKVDTNWAVHAALFHDIEESMTGDFLRSFKKSSPELDKAIKKGARVCAMRVFRELDPGDRRNLIEYWDMAKSDEHPSAPIVRFADFLSVLSYLSKEAAMGNLYAQDMLKYELSGYADLFDDQPMLENFLKEARQIIYGGWRDVRVNV